MSFDLNLSTQCDHRVFRELALIESDRRTLYLESPLGSVGNIQVYAADNLIPSFMYDIVEDVTQTDLAKRKYIQFKQKWRCLTDYFEIVYNTLLEYCTKCKGYKYLDDISYDVKGGLAEIRNEYLLMQNVEKFVITELNSNPFHVYIGTGLVGLIGKRVTNTTFLTSQMTSEISRTLQKLQELQSQYQQTGRVVTNGELLATVDNINVRQDVDNPSLFWADVSVIAQSGQTVTFSQPIRVY